MATGFVDNCFIDQPADALLRDQKLFFPNNKFTPIEKKTFSAGLGHTAQDRYHDFERGKELWNGQGEEARKI